VSLREPTNPPTDKRMTFRAGHAGHAGHAGNNLPGGTPLICDGDNLRNGVGCCNHWSEIDSNHPQLPLDFRNLHHV
jgi:hypothetical protein